MKIKFFICFCLLAVNLHAWEGPFALSEEAQKKAGFYNKFLKALELKNNGDSDNALTLFKELLDITPEDKILIQEYCFLVLDKQAEVFNFCKEKLQNTENKNWQIYTLLGDYYLREGSLNAALNEYEQALKLNPENLELAFHYANILASKDQQKAVAYLQKSAEDYPQTNAFITLKIADIYLKNKESGQAISVLKEGLNSTQNKAEIYGALIKIYEAERNQTELYQTYKDIEKAGLADVSVLEKLANTALLQKEDSAAQDYFTKLVSMDAVNPFAARYFALAEEGQGRYESALNYIKQARDFDSNPALQIKAGYYLSMLSKQQELLDLMESAYKKFAGNREISYYYALALADAKKYNQAAKVFEEMLKTLPEDEHILFSYATLLYEQKKYAKMEKTLRRLLEINPNNAEALNFLGYFLIDRRGKKYLEEGRRLVTSALEKSPKELAYLDSLAWYYFKAGNYVEAQKIIQTLPDINDEEIYLHKAQIAAALKDYETAAKYYKNVLRINPKNKAAKKGLHQSEKKN